MQHVEIVIKCKKESSIPKPLQPLTADAIICSGVNKIRDV